MAVSKDAEAALAAKFAVMRRVLDERQWRVYLGTEARALGYGGIAAVARAAGVSELTVAAGASEAEDEDGPGVLPPGRARRPGGGRKKLEDGDPGLVPALEELLDDSTMGDPCSPLKWTTKSLVNLAGELARRGHRCRKDAVARLLRQLGYSTQGNAATMEGRQHPDRDGQFRYISATAKAFLAAGDPVVSVDSKKKEQVGPYGQQGREWRPKGDPVRVRDHDFPDPQLGKVTPYGVYDLGANSGFVNVGTDHDTAAFAVESIRRWWHAAGKDRYPGRRRLAVMCDAGGSNSYKNKAWKDGLARLAAETGLEITVCHFPPGTSKWNKIEHRLFCQITRNWRGRPLVSHEVIINTIAAVTTGTGLTVTAVLDEGSYPKKAKVSAGRMKYLEDRVLDRHAYHGEWNYTVRPAPAGPEPEPEPEPPAAPGPDLEALAALAGIGDLGALLEAVAVPWAAAREQRLHLDRGAARRKASGGGPKKLPFEAIVTAAACHQRLRIPYRLLGELFGAHQTTISLAARRVIPLLEAHGITQGGGTRIATLDELTEHAATAGITLTTATTGQPAADHAKRRST